jgi:deazaflavin-dependent oxidoreductase (nitroreductase family)
MLASYLAGLPLARWLHAGLLYPEPGYALRASAGPARTQARPAAPAGGPQAGQPGGIRQQLDYAAGTRNGDDGPDPAAGQRQPLPRPIFCGTARYATHNPYFPPLLNLAIPWPDQPHAPPARLVSVSDHYRAPGWFTRNVFNQLVAFLTRQGISVLGSRVLAVKGRTSGQWRTTPVNLLTHDGRRYLVAPRGETQWVRNLRAVGTGELRLGRRAETFRGRELTDDEKVPVLRAYLKRWKAEVGIFFEGTGPDSGDEQIRAIAPKHPAFEVLPVK